MKSVCLLGYYGAENFGDEILLGSTIALLDSVETFNIKIFTSNEKITAKQYPFYSAIPKFNPLEVLSALINSEALVLGGGSLFQDASSLKSVIYYSSVVFAAKMLGKKVIFLSQGIGPLKGYWAKFLTQCACQMADWISVRDQESLKFVKRWNSSVLYAPDLAWSVFYEDKTFAEPLSNEDLSGESYNLEREINLNNVQKVLVSLRSDKLKDIELEVITNGLSYHYPEATFVMAALQKEDLKILEKLSESFNKFEIVKLYELEDGLDKFELNQIFKDIDLAFCMRFHAVLVAVGLSIPTAALAYDPKVDELCKQVNLPYLTLNQFEDQEVFNKFIQSLESRLPTKKSMAESVEVLANLSKEINTKILRSLVDELSE